MSAEPSKMGVYLDLQRVYGDCQIDVSAFQTDQRLSPVCRTIISASGVPSASRVSLKISDIIKCMRLNAFVLGHTLSVDNGREKQEMYCYVELTRAVHFFLQNAKSSYG